jgi:hypothetical protein
MTSCSKPACDKPVDRGGLCFRCRVAGVGFGFQSSAAYGRQGWNKTATEYRLENFGTADERELGRRGIVRAADYEISNRGN